MKYITERELDAILLAHLPREDREAIARLARFDSLTNEEFEVWYDENVILPDLLENKSY